MYANHLRIEFACIRTNDPIDNLIVVNSAEFHLICDHKTTHSYTYNSNRYVIANVLRFFQVLIQLERVNANQWNAFRFRVNTAFAYVANIVVDYCVLIYYAERLNVCKCLLIARL